MSAGEESLLGLRGKAAIILGGGRGMGEASALLLAEAGADVAIIDQEGDRARDVAAKVRAAGVNGVPVIADILNPAGAEAAIMEAERALKRLDVLISIVGQASFASLLDLSEAQWDLDHNRNLRYFFFAARTAAKAMIKHGRGGAIAAVASVDGQISAPVHGAYGAAKAGLIQLVQTMAVEWAEHGIRVNAIAPGSINTPRLPETAQSRQLMADSLVPMHRAGTTREIGTALLFLVSDMASYVTGQTLAVDGGWTVANLFDPRRFTVKTST